jgi:hypothetical protein
VSRIIQDFSASNDPRYILSIKNKKELGKEKPLIAYSIIIPAAALVL